MATMTPATMVSVRQLRVADWEGLRDVRLRALIESPSSYYGTYDDEVRSDRSRWERWLSPPSAIFVAERDDDVVGMIGGIPAGEDEGDADAMMMVAMWVDPVARGNGIAEALTDSLIGWARDEGYPRMVLWVYDVNPRAAAFYRRYGFADTGRTEVFEKDPRELHLMTLTL
jgi:GNAT superfamily N-acetyltransferase